MEIEGIAAGALDADVFGIWPEGLKLGGEYGGRLTYDKAPRTIVCRGKPLGIGIEDTVLA